MNPANPIVMETVLWIENSADACITHETFQVSVEETNNFLAVALSRRWVHFQ